MCVGVGVGVGRISGALLCGGVEAGLGSEPVSICVGVGVGVGVGRISEALSRLA